MTTEAARESAAPIPRTAIRARRIDRAVALTVWLLVGLVLAGFLWIIGDLAYHGLPELSWQFLVEAPRNAGRAGGIGPILVSTLLILLVCLGTAVPLGVATAVLLSELTRGTPWFGNLVRRSLDILAGVPSIVFGLFGNAFFALFLGLGFSVLSGGLTLACMVLPILIRATEEGLRSVPDDYRRAAAALALPYTATLRHILLPMAAPGLLVGLVLGIGRALAETAALLFTSGYVSRMPGSLFDSGRALSVHIFDLAMNVPGGADRAYASALILIALLLAINAAAGALGERLLQQRNAKP